MKVSTTSDACQEQEEPPFVLTTGKGVVGQSIDGSKKVKNSRNSHKITAVVSEKGDLLATAVVEVAVTTPVKEALEDARVKNTAEENGVKYRQAAARKLKETAVKVSETLKALEEAEAAVNAAEAISKKADKAAADTKHVARIVANAANAAAKKAAKAEAKLIEAAEVTAAKQTDANKALAAYNDAVKKAADAVQSAASLAVEL